MAKSKKNQQIIGKEILPEKTKKVISLVIPNNLEQDMYILKSQKNQPFGVAGLDEKGKIPEYLLPAQGLAKYFGLYDGGDFKDGMKPGDYMVSNVEGEFNGLQLYNGSFIVKEEEGYSVQVIKKELENTGNKIIERPFEYDNHEFFENENTGLEVLPISNDKYISAVLFYDTLKYIVTIPLKKIKDKIKVLDGNNLSEKIKEILEQLLEEGSLNVSLGGDKNFIGLYDGTQSLEDNSIEIGKYYISKIKNSDKNILIGDIIIKENEGWSIKSPQIDIEKITELLNQYLKKEDISKEIIKEIEKQESNLKEKILDIVKNSLNDIYMKKEIYDINGNDVVDCAEKILANNDIKYKFKVFEVDNIPEEKENDVFYFGI